MVVFIVILVIYVVFDVDGVLIGMIFKYLLFSYKFYYERWNILFKNWIWIIMKVFFFKNILVVYFVLSCRFIFYGFMGKFGLVCCRVIVFFK